MLHLKSSLIYSLFLVPNQFHLTHANNDHKRSLPSPFLHLQAELLRVKKDLGLESKRPIRMQMQARALSGNDMKLLNGYGCWCDFKTYSKSGHYGQPVDFFDNACKVLKEGYECILMDSEEENATEGTKVCDVAKTKYNSALGSGHPTGMTMDILVKECDLINHTNCQKRLCKVEGWFIQSILKKTYADGVIPDIFAYSHETAGFKPEEQCLRTPSKNPEVDCCGEYPRRFTFRHSSGNRACCKGRTYNAAVLSCCDDGSARISCE